MAVLGSTGSVGTNALRLLAERTDHFDVVLLTAHRSRDTLEEQVERFAPRAACLVAGELPARRDASVAWFEGKEGLLEALEAADPDLVLNAITGAAGLPPSEWTLRRGRTLALANKESYVMAGAWLVELARESGATVLPVDSEHSAIFQCLAGERRDRVRRVWLTGSGGPFRTRPLDTFASITPEEALRHPTWDMGPRITVGSATMMNKAFEVLEARWLFDLEPERIEVIIHPQSVVHSMVEFVDGSMLAQLGLPDMRVPILYALGWPDRLPFRGFEPFDPRRFAQLTFEPVDRVRYPAIDLAFETLRRGGDSGAVLNAADEVLTSMFLNREIDFPAITATVAEVLRSRAPRTIASLADVLEADREARSAAGRAASAGAGGARVPEHP